MITSKMIAVFVMLPWLWALFQVLAFGRLLYVIYMIPYLLLIKNAEKESAEKKSKSTNVDVQDFPLVAKKDASTSTDEIDLANNKTSDEKIDQNTGNRQDDLLLSHPFLEMIENFGQHGDPFNPFNTEAIIQLGNPFLGFNEPAAALNFGESCPLLLPTNPFFQECGNNPFLDTSLQFPTVLEDEFTNIPFVPRESDVYCKEWVEKHRKGYIKTVCSFSCY
ncbi:hypothetical protein AVEN_21421-1 [Araneus ventricosus]|uniref:Uncharacterized protein n=1 Tax=Araneus ventricosus TaxID=182803 RepID=A0A4Y2QM94_ARAVE|nr:hypothetical protein AVEN_21421-1 [Araneus ventricosus]